VQIFCLNEIHSEFPKGDHLGIVGAGLFLIPDTLCVTETAAPQPRSSDSQT